MKAIYSKKTLLLLVAVFSIIFTHRLSAIDYQKIIKHVNNTPNNVRNSTAKLSAYLCMPYKTDKEKFASIYYWVAKNISYNDAQAKKAIYYENVNEIIEQVMKRKSGVCQHFAELFAQLGRQAGLEVFVVSGYTRTDGKVDDLSHAWNIVKVSGKWYFIDATWAGSVIKTASKNQFPMQFYMMTPEENIKRRMSFDPLWQALSNPANYQKFDSGSITFNNKGNFNYNDSIKAFNKLTLIDKQKATMRRMKANGRFNTLVKKEYSLMERNYKMLIQNQEVVKYNKGTNYYNTGMSFFNQYVKLKNKKSDLQKYGKKRLNGIIDSVSTNLKKAEDLFASVKTNNSEMRNYLKKNSINIKKVNEVIRKERKFVEEWFK